MTDSSEKIRIQKSRISARVTHILMYTVLILGCLIVLVPILYIILGAFKTDKEIAKSSAFALPEHFSFDSFKEVLSSTNVNGIVKSSTNLLLSFKNTAIIIVISCVGTIFTGTMTAFVIQRFNTLLSRIVKGAFLIAMLLPTISMQVTVYRIVNSLNIGDFRIMGTLWAPIILYVGTDIVSIYIFIQFLSQIPVSLDESGIVDGASYPRIYFSIILPNLKPAIATVLIIKFISIYNDFYTPKLYLSEDKPVISTVLLNIMNQTNVSYSVEFAGVILCIIPTLIIFLFLQKYIYSGLVSGAVKE